MTKNNKTAQIANIISFEDAQALRKNSILKVDGKPETIQFVDKISNPDVVYVYTDKYVNSAIAFCRDEKVAKKERGPKLDVEATGTRAVIEQPKKKAAKKTAAKKSAAPKKAPGKVATMIRQLLGAGLSVNQVAKAMEVMPVMVRDVMKIQNIADPAKKMVKKAAVKTASLKTALPRAAKVVTAPRPKKSIYQMNAKELAAAAKKATKNTGTVSAAERAFMSKLKPVAKKSAKKSGKK